MSRARSPIPPNANHAPRLSRELNETRQPAMTMRKDRIDFASHLSEVQFKNGSNDMRWRVGQICLVFTIFK